MSEELFGQIFALIMLTGFIAYILITAYKEK